MLMTVRLKRVLLTAVSGSALALAPLTFATVVVPAASHADQQCKDPQSVGGDPNEQCAAQPQKLDCPDGTIVDTKNKQCVSLTAGISKELAALPAPPSLSGFGGGGGGVGSLGKFPSLGTVNLPDIVLPSLGLNLVPNVNLNLQPKLPVFNPLNLP